MKSRLLIKDRERIFFKTSFYISMDKTKGKSAIFLNFFIFNNGIKSLSYIRGQNQDKIGPVSKIFLIFYN